MRSFLALVLFAASIGQANAVEGFVDGNKLLEWCESQTGPNQLSCMMYVAGVSDAWDVATNANKSESCTPAAAPLKQVAAVVLKYLNQHPEERHMPAAALAFVAINEAWCKSH
jgi:hypothetical protein